MLDFSRPFGAENQDQELVIGLETFDPFANYTETTVAAFYAGSCSGGGGSINFDCRISVE